MWQQFTIQGNIRHLDILPKILKQYNDTEHSRIKMTPVEASRRRNEGTVYLIYMVIWSINHPSQNFK